MTVVSAFSTSSTFRAFLGKGVGKKAGAMGTGARTGHHDGSSRRIATWPAAALSASSSASSSLAMARPLTLHLSALSDDEYPLYTSSLSEISSPTVDFAPGAEDAFWEDRMVSLREARGWMRGRYGVDGTVIDTILRMFSPTLGPADTMTSGQFFAAMRLVLYAQRGYEPDRALVFMQPPSIPNPNPKSATRSQSSERSRAVAAAAAPVAAPQTSHSTPLASGSANPFQRSAQQRPRVTLDPFSEPSLTVSSPALSANPFRSAGRSSHALPTPATSPTPSHFPLPSTAYPANIQHSPPLPPRKPAFPPPPQRTPVLTHSSSSSSSLRVAASSKAAPPPPPPKPANLAVAGTSGAVGHTSDLIQKSLHAARTIGVQRRAESELAGARMLEVIRSTSSPSPTHTGDAMLASGSTSASAPPSIVSGRKRAVPSPPTSILAASETSSLERVAIATTRFPSRDNSPPTRPTTTKARPPLPPPLLRSATTAAQLPRSPFAGSSTNSSPSDEDFAFASSSPGPPRPPPRTVRSHSIHSSAVAPASMMLIPPPIPKRPRPESLQLAQMSSPVTSSPFSPVSPPGPGSASAVPPVHPSAAAAAGAGAGAGAGAAGLRRSVSSAASPGQSHHRSARSLGSGLGNGLGSSSSSSGVGGGGGGGVGVGGDELIGALRDSFNALGLQARERVHEARERLEKRHVAKHGSRAETRGLARDRQDDDAGTGDGGGGGGGGVGVDADEDEDEERARRGWRPLA